MNYILDKISSYNIFNNLLPGIVFVILTSKLTIYNLIHGDHIIGIFLYYFIGLIISRIGSLIIEPSLKYIHFLNGKNYKGYIKASKIDSKIELLLEVKNTYRTMCSLIISVIFLKIFEALETRYIFLKDWKIEISLVVILFLFVFSLRKQTNYITKRIMASKSA
jgi:hypothetical protein